jgi:hypothetical protein
MMQFKLDGAIGQNLIVVGPNPEFLIGNGNQFCLLPFIVEDILFFTRVVANYVEYIALSLCILKVI